MKIDAAPKWGISQAVSMLLHGLDISVFWSLNQCSLPSPLSIVLHIHISFSSEHCPRFAFLSLPEFPLGWHSLPYLPILSHLYREPPLSTTYYLLPLLSTSVLISTAIPIPYFRVSCLSTPFHGVLYLSASPPTHFPRRVYLPAPTPVEST